MNKDIKGAFLIYILGIFINVDNKEDAYDAYYHELIHYFDYMSSTYGVHLVVEIMEAIELMVYRLGGSIIMPFSYKSKRLLDGSSWKEHFEKHSELFEGRYVSVSLRTKGDFENYIIQKGLIIDDSIERWWEELQFAQMKSEDCEISIMDKFGVFHYIRWNYIDQTYFVTELGIRTLLECNAYINDKIYEARKSGKKKFTLQQSRFCYGVSSYNHIYTAPIELFYDSCKHIIRTDKDGGNVINLLSIIIDLCLHMPIAKHAVRDEERLFLPSVCYIKMVEAIKSLSSFPLVDGNEKDIQAFLINVLEKEVPQYNYRNRPSIVIKDTIKVMQQDINFYTIYLSSMQVEVDDVSENMAQFYKELWDMGKDENITEGFRQYLLKNMGGIIQDSFGFGIYQLLLDNLKIRFERPLLFPFAQVTDVCLENKQPPFFYVNGYLNLNLKDITSVFLARDVIELKHLVALLFQIYFNAETECVCGYNYYQIKCPYREGGCMQKYVWKSNSLKAYRSCEFSMLLLKYGLTNAKEDMDI